MVKVTRCHMTLLLFLSSLGANPKGPICLNPDCADYQKANTGNIINMGFNAKGNQMFKCKTCGV